MTPECIGPNGRLYQWTGTTWVPLPKKVHPQPKQPTLLFEIDQYLDDKFVDYEYKRLPEYDDGVPRRGRKKKKKGFQLLLLQITTPILRQVVLPALQDLAERHNKKVKLAHYIPKKKKFLLEMVKVQVY